MHIDIDRLVGQLTREQTRELALACMIELTDDDQIDLIKELVLQDAMFRDELIEHLIDADDFVAEEEGESS